LLLVVSRGQGPLRAFTRTSSAPRPASSPTRDAGSSSRWWGARADFFRRRTVKVRSERVGAFRPCTTRPRELAAELMEASRAGRRTRSSSSTTSSRGHPAAAGRRPAAAIERHALRPRSRRSTTSTSRSRRRSRHHPPKHVESGVAGAPRVERGRARCPHDLDGLGHNNASEMIDRLTST